MTGSTVAPESEDRLHVVDVSVAIPNRDPMDVLRYAANVVAPSDHPIARAITAAGRAATGPDTESPLEVTGFVAHAAGGVEGLVRRAHAGLAPAGVLNTRRVLVGHLGWLAEQGVAIPDEVRSTVRQHEEAGATAIAVAWDGGARGVIALRDQTVETAAAQRKRRPSSFR